MLYLPELATEALQIVHPNFKGFLVFKLSPVVYC